MTGDAQRDHDTQFLGLQDLLREILDAHAAGLCLDREQLEERFPGHELILERLSAALGTSRIRSRGFSCRHPGAILDPGCVLGDYVIESYIASGGKGQVYRARQRSLGDRPVALKIVWRTKGIDRQEAQFRREALLASSLHHPNLADVYGFGSCGDLLYYAMRLVEGPTLRDILQRLVDQRDARHDQTLRRRLVARFGDVAGALAVLHQAGLVHRDIKPGNIMLAGRGSPSETVPEQPAVLVDFGLLRPVHSETLTQTLQPDCTASYASPEQLLGQEVDSRSDVFSLGVTMHDLLAGRLPEERLPAPSGLEPLDEIVPGLDRDLTAIVAKAADPVASYRYADGASLRCDLLAWLQGNPVSARRLHPVESTVRWIRRYPGRIAAGLTLSAGLVLVVLGTLGVRDVWLAAREAERSFVSGDVLAFSRACKAIPGLFQHVLLRDAVRENTLGILRNDQSDPIVRIAEQLSSGRNQAATHEAAVAVRTQGVEHTPLLARFLVRQLNSSSASKESTELRSLALLLTCRVFDERPDMSPAASAASAPIRDRLQVLLAQEIPQLDRLQAMAALSGCGTLRSIPVLLGQVKAAESASEIHLRGLRCIERILRRAHWCGLIDANGSDEAGPLAQEIETLSLELSPGDSDALAIGSWWSLLKALAFFNRARNAETSVDNSLFTHYGGRFGKELRAAAADPLLGSELASGDGFVPDLAQRWGWCCGAYGEVPITNQARQSCVDMSRRLGVALFEAFEQGFKEGCLQRSGIIPAYDPDPASQINAPPQKDAFVNLGPIGLSTRQAPRGCVAAWDLGGECILTQGGAGAVRVTGVTSPSSPSLDSARIIMDAFGRSEAHLEFELPADVVNDVRDRVESLELHLWHLAAARWYIPFKGMATISVAIDGTEIGRFLVSRDSWIKNVVRIPEEHLRPGRQVLMIGLEDSSTTTYRLRQVILTRGRGDATDAPEGF
ncbi:MAG: serine/threonine-protein kinase [Planctomycetota bacterium]